MNNVLYIHFINKLNSLHKYNMQMLFSPVCVCVARRRRVSSICLMRRPPPPPPPHLCYIYFIIWHYTVVCIILLCVYMCCACLQCSVIKRYAPSSSLSPFYTMYFMKRKYLWNNDTHCTNIKYICTTSPSDITLLLLLLLLKISIQQIIKIFLLFFFCTTK